MSKFAWSYTPKTIASQLMVLLVIVLVIAQIVNLFIIVGERRIQARANIFSSAMEQTIQIIQQLPTEHLNQAPRGISNRGLNGFFFLSKNNITHEIGTSKVLSRYEKIFKDKLAERNIIVSNLSFTLNSAEPQYEVYKKKFHKNRHSRPSKHRRPQTTQSRDRNQDSLTITDDMPKEELIVSVELKPNVWINGILPHRSIEALTPRILIATSILLTLTLLTSWFFIRRISKPLSTLTLAAERFGRGDSSLVLREEGPTDIRRAVRAFNTMQDRLSRTLETQRTMLRAVGHDLRTPLTSLRLRSELLSDESAKEKFIDIIEDMTMMTEEILNWTKNASAIEEVKAIDLHSFLSSIVDDFSEQGKQIELENFTPTVIHIRRIAIKRALLNLIGNALKYGQSAHISVQSTDQHIDIHIDDIGPGIPDNMVEEALKPFVRLEDSRNKKTGGTGLGLSIAKSIIESDGGKLILANKATGGLRVSVCLPKRSLSENNPLKWI